MWLGSKALRRIGQIIIRVVCIQRVTCDNTFVQLRKKKYSFKKSMSSFFFALLLNNERRWLFKSDFRLLKEYKSMLFLLLDFVTVVLDLVFFHLKPFHTTLILPCSICFFFRSEAFNHMTKGFVWMRFNSLKSHFQVQKKAFMLLHQETELKCWSNKNKIHRWFNHESAPIGHSLNRTPVDELNSIDRAK